MSRTVITAEGIGKAYRLGVQESRQDMREQIMTFLRTPLKRLRKFNEDWSDGEDTFWALKDVNFEVKEGEVVGIIGRNGAGKSTLLKVLSRITEPTEGEARMKGRVSSLLEVGTGFHPELTGRENIFLNGAILGMKRGEIKKKFDQIVDFSEVAKFLDTPVKRYSSGMYVRLAFAVAAHLEPEIMIVDEVLAVGDAAFQKKCLGKMGDVVKEGRTILFVSHSMDAVASLCGTVMVVNGGRCGPRVATDEGIKQYLGLVGDTSSLPLAEKPRTQHKKRAPIFTGLKMSNNVIPAGGGITFEVEISDLHEPGEMTCGLALYNERNHRVCLFHTLYNNNMTFRGGAKKILTCEIPSLPLTAGQYHVELVLSDGYHELERVDRADKFQIIYGDVLGTGKIPNHRQCAVILPCQWRE